MTDRSRALEVLIAGGGTVGAALARALPGMRRALVANERPPSFDAGSGWDARVYAINPANVEFLRSIGCWHRLPAERLAPIHRMRVFGDDGESSIEFDAYGAGVAELAWIVEDRELQRALWGGIEKLEGLRIFSPAALSKMAVAEKEVDVDIGEVLKAKLVIGADGAQSRVRAEAGIGWRERPYGQTAVVANFAAERPHGGTAFQWFQGGAVLALLPLPGERVSMVWSIGDEDAARLLALPPEELCSEVARASGNALGALSPVTPARGLPLKRGRAARMVAPRVALAGDAAHVIHPLAGQGANLGLGDARALAHALASREEFREPGELRCLRRYERARAEAILAMDATVHGLQRLFGSESEIATRARNSGLGLVDRMPLVKNLLMRHAMG